MKNPKLVVFKCSTWYNKEIILRGAVNLKWNFPEGFWWAGLQYLRARYYNTKTGRFISKDAYRGDFSQPGTLNRYAYCGGNPANRIDPSGYFAGAIAGTVITAEVVAAALTATSVACLIAAFSESILDFISNVGSSINNALDTLVQKATKVWGNNKNIFSGSNQIIGEIGAGIAGIISLGEALTTAVEKAKERKKYYPQNDPVHHIIAQADPRALISRKVLVDAGISVQDPQNLIQIDINLHQHLHRGAYYTAVDEIMTGFQALGDALGAISPKYKEALKTAAVRMGLQIIRTTIQIADKSVKAAKFMR